MKTSGTKALKLVYLIYGGQRLLLEEALERLKGRIAQQADLNFNYEEFRGGEDDASAIIQAAETFPLMSEKRLVVVKEAEKLSPTDLSLLADYVKNPSPHTCLVLVAGKLKKSSRLYKVVKESGGDVYEYKPPSKRGYPQWIKDAFLKRNKVVTNAAADYIFQTVGQDLHNLKGEIEKICLFHEDKKRLDVADIQSLVSKSAESTIFDLVGCLGQRDEAKVLAILDNLLQGREPLERILPMIIRHFRLLLKTKVLLERGVDGAGLVSELKLPPFVVDGYRLQSRNFSHKQLKRAHELLLDADLATKTGKGDPRFVLEMLTMKILGEGV